MQKSCTLFTCMAYSIMNFRKGCIPYMIANFFAHYHLCLEASSKLLLWNQYNW